MRVERLSASRSVTRQATHPWVGLVIVAARGRGGSDSVPQRGGRRWAISVTKPLWEGLYLGQAFPLYYSSYGRIQLTPLALDGLTG